MGVQTFFAKRRPALAAILLLLLPAAPALGQFSEGYNFLKAVRDRDGNKATAALDKAGAPINTRDGSTGETPLMIVTKGRDLTWMGFLLGKGAKPDLRDGAGDTPLATAAQIGFVEGVQLLLSVGASPDLANARGETPLIVAVQRRDLAVARLLLAANANPALTDHVAGKSARDYAVEDRRAAAILRLIDDAKPRAPVSGPPRPAR